MAGATTPAATRAATTWSAATPCWPALGDYGGPTPTLALLPGSPAIGGGGSVTALSSAGVTDTSSTSVTVANGLVFAASSLPVLSSGSYFLIQVDSEQMAVVGVTLNADHSATLDVGVGRTGRRPPRIWAPSVYLASDQPGYTRGGAATSPPSRTRASPSRPSMAARRRRSCW